jgi:hypothetical protein
MTRTIWLAIPAIVLLSACGSPSAYEARSANGYYDGYRPAYGSPYGYGYSSYGYNDRIAYGSGYRYYHSRDRNLQPPSDY